ncbi:MAG: hypothetical protein ABJB05_10920 [Parafilimonas sp.]
MTNSASKGKTIFIWVQVIAGVVAIIISILSYWNSNETAKKQDINDIASKISSSLAFFNINDGDTLSQSDSNYTVKGLIDNHIPTQYKLFALLRIGNVYNIMHSNPIKIMNKKGAWQNEYYIGIKGNVSLCVALCDEQSSQILEAKINAGQSQLQGLLDGMTTLGSVNVYKK